jgi:transcription initiation factor TFIIB
MQSIEAIVKRQHTIHREGCPECGSEDLVTDGNAGEIACQQCGLVLREVMLDRRPEWRAFTREERLARSRVGSPTSLRHFDKGLATTFQPYKDAYGQSLPAEQRSKMQRLNKWNRRAVFHSSIHRNLAQAMTELCHLADKLHLPKAVAEEAASIYRKALDTELVRGRSISAMLSASLYAACRLTRTPRNLKTIVGASTKSWREIARCYRLLLRTLNLAMPIDDATRYVAQIASKVHISPKTQHHATQLLRQAKTRQGIAGKGPVGLAAAAIYTASIMDGEDVTQRDLAEASGVTEVTIRNRYKGLDECLKLGLR